MRSAAASGGGWFLVFRDPRRYKRRDRGSSTPGGCRGHQQNQPGFAQLTRLYRLLRGFDIMATVTLIKAAARSKGSKGAARAERRSGRVPGIIYGDGKPPMPISLDYNELRQRIFAGHFLTTVHDVEIDGVKHRVIPRDFQLDAVRDLPLHVDFMRLGEGATIRVNIPIHVRNADQSPGVKRGGTVSIVSHSIEVRCRADAIPTGIEVDVGGLDINHSRHLSDIKLPEGVRVVSGRDITLVTVVPPSGYAEELKAAAEAAAATAAAAAAAAAAPAAPTGAPGSPGSAPAAAA